MSTNISRVCDPAGTRTTPLSLSGRGVGVRVRVAYQKIAPPMSTPPSLLHTWIIFSSTTDRRYYLDVVVGVSFQQYYPIRLVRIG